MKRVGDLTNPRIAALYSQVPPDRLAAFQAFRRDFPATEVTLEGVPWCYLTGGEGDPPVLTLSGALVIPDISWTTIAGLAGSWRVIAPAYPPVATMGALVDGIAALLRHEGVEQADVVGGSYGGLVAQVLVRRYPHLVRALVLSHTQPPYPETAARLQRFVGLMRWLPMGVVRQMIQRAFGSMMPERTDETACMLATYNELVAFALTRRDVIGILERTVDYSKQVFTPQDLATWSGKVLLVFGEDDPSTPPEVRDRLGALYPGCQVGHFEGSGHTTAVTRREEYLTLIDEFLRHPGR
jgi:pimeloyl-ACP methyl ester carboxylesterase